MGPARSQAEGGHSADGVFFVASIVTTTAGTPEDGMISTIIMAAGTTLDALDRLRALSACAPYCSTRAIRCFR